MKALLSSLLLGTLLALPLRATDEALVSFGENSSTAGKAKLIGPNAPKVQLNETKQSLQIQAPDPWSTIVQVLEIEPASLASFNPGDSLSISVKGVPGGNAPRLKVQLVAPGNWQQWASWDFDLSSIKPDEFTTITAETNLQSPSEKLGEELPASAGTIQIFTKAKSPGQWNLEIKSLGRSPAN